MKVTLSERPLSAGRKSLCLCYSDGGRRVRRALGIVLEPETCTGNRRRNRERLELARRICAKYELEQTAARHGMSRGEPRRLLLLEAWQDFEFTYCNRDLHIVHAVGAHLSRFVGRRSVRMSQDVTPDFCKQFYAYLCEHLRGTTPAGYFNKFRTFLRRHADEGCWDKRPDRELHTPASNIREKAALSPDELRRLARTPCLVADVARAFLFSCNTGLRWCDVRSLRADDVDQDAGTLHIVQRKVAGRSRRAEVSLSLNSNALTLLAQRRRRGLVFRLPSYSYMLRVLDQWARRAGVARHVTFHVARHTFITQLALSGTPLPVVAALAGHASTRHTERYIHIADTQCRQAVERLPALDFGQETAAASAPRTAHGPLSATPQPRTPGRTAAPVSEAERA